ncbi:hypothetical protein [Kibdelosporangium phytohabitans]|uniref:hypothetical protein n=1 Tax=Kibdelosporangium phytohabitans TaxID=860235 RepID=UPI0012FA02D5|nr:hypothetical protein [Kibdelosporangium phytohabitans]MBE1464799.1 hypothetical protein [Kibdelosporangium phytohabitans]
MAADNRPTFFAHALALAAAHGPGPWPGGGYPLPDEQSVPFMSGAVRDGINTHHSRVEDGRAVAAEIADAVRTIIESPPDLQALQRLHDLAVDIDVLPVADPLGKQLLGAHRARVRDVGRWLAEYGTRRDAVATGIVLIGLTGDERDRELLLLMGSLEDLTLYSVVALERTQSDRDMAIFEMARRVRAWGRIQAVERLEGTTDPEIKAWLVREGFRNDVMDEYLAYIAATTGDLADALMTSDADDELLDGAGGILAALSDVSGPARTIDDYPDGAAVIDRYLTLVRDRPTLARVVAVLKLGDKGRDVATGLDWLSVVQSALHSPDPDTFTTALWPAEQLGMKVRDKVNQWLRSNPSKLYLWWYADAGELAELAEQLLPLADLATGPQVEYGVGAEFAADRVLDLVVGREGGRNWPLVRTALANRLTRNRYNAVKALTDWPRDSLPADAVPAVRAAVEAEPVDELKAALADLLRELSRPVVVTWARRR